MHEEEACSTYCVGVLDNRANNFLIIFIAPASHIYYKEGYYISIRQISVSVRQSFDLRYR